MIGGYKSINKDLRKELEQMKGQELKKIKELSTERVEDKELNLILDILELDTPTCKLDEDTTLYRIKRKVRYIRIALNLKEVSTLTALLKDKAKSQKVHDTIDKYYTTISTMFYDID